MAKDIHYLLRQRYLSLIESKWIMNNHNLKDISCIYVIVKHDFLNPKIRDIEYIGSTKKLYSRYKSHKIPGKIQSDNGYNILYYMPMKSDFYDYEIKLIKKLKPRYNKQHK
jgi:hypothetical protein